MTSAREWIRDVYGQRAGPDTYRLTLGVRAAGLISFVEDCTQQKLGFYSVEACVLRRSSFSDLSGTQSHAW